MLLVSHGCETLEFVENIGYSKPYDSTNPILFPSVLNSSLAMILHRNMQPYEQLLVET